MDHIKRHSKRALIGVIGTIVVLAGVIMIPYPGPGWLVVFAGLAVLATEFAFAAQLLQKARSFYNQWLGWIKRQPRIIQLATLTLSGLVVVATLWLLNTFGFINTFFQLDQDWLVSPFMR
jgi:uncharacterized protein (TIGR02611 family)